MGQVFRAWDPRLQREVALKVLRPGRSDAAAEELDTACGARLRREAQAMAQLSHPNVVPVFDVLQVSGQLVIAMEVVAGVTLSRWLRTSRTRGQILEVFVAAGRGLAAAHASGLVHRDFKPANVMIGDADGRARVMDFGLARPAGTHGSDTGSPSASSSWLGDALDVTATGVMMGTPAYMAPEQHQGGTPDAASDQFAFCVALFEALCGERPFRADGTAALARDKQREIFDDRALRRHAPAWLAAAVARGLRAKPSDRWPTMEALLRRLERRGSSGRRGWAAVVGVGLLVGGSGWAVGSTASGDDEACTTAQVRLQGIWDAPRAESVREALLASGATQAAAIASEVGTALDGHADAWAREYESACAGRLAGEPSAEAPRLECLERRRQELAGWVDLLAQADAAVAGSAVRGSQGLVGAERCEEAEFLRERVEAPADANVAARADAIRAGIVRAKHLQQTGKIRQARERTATVVAQARALGYRPSLAEALVQAASLQQTAGDYPAAQRDYEEAFWLASDAGEDRGAMVAAIELTFIVGARLARFEEGLSWSRHARAALDRLGNPPLWERQLARGLAGISHGRGDAKTAAEHTRRSLALAIQIYGDEHPQVAESHNNLAVMLQAQGDLEAAAVELERAIELWQRAYGPQFANIAIALNNLGSLEDELGRTDDAVAHGERALQLWTASAGDEHPRTANIHANLGQAYLHQERFDDAQEHLSAAARIFSATLGPEHPNLSAVWASMAELEEARGDSAGALVHLREASSLAEAGLGPQHPQTVALRADVRRLSGDAPSEAVDP
jgi:tetratricopeptide (TPR) repeat protein